MKAIVNKKGVMLIGKEGATEAEKKRGELLKNAKVSASFIKENFKNRVVKLGVAEAGNTFYKKVSNLSTARAESCDHVIIQNFYDEARRLVQQSVNDGLQTPLPEDVISFDEIGVSKDNMNKYWGVFDSRRGKSGDRSYRIVEGEGNATWTSLGLATNGAGYLYPLTVIHESDNKNYMTANMALNLSEETIVTTAISGYMDINSFVETIVALVNHHRTVLKNTRRGYLIMDGFYAHIQSEYALKFLTTNNFKVLYIPSHTSINLQANDKRINSLVASLLKSEIAVWHNSNPGLTNSVEFLNKIIMNVYNSLLTGESSARRKELITQQFHDTLWTETICSPFTEIPNLTEILLGTTNSLNVRQIYTNNPEEEQSIVSARLQTQNFQVTAVSASPAPTVMPQMYSILLTCSIKIH